MTAVVYQKDCSGLPKGLQSSYKTTAVICTHAPKTLHLEKLGKATRLLLYNSTRQFMRGGRDSAPYQPHSVKW